MENPEMNALRDLVDAHLEELSSQFDSVLIITTKYDKDIKDTVSYSNYEGNFYASLGAIEMWLTSTKQDQLEDDRNSDTD